jgi:hypothetical protein
MEIHHTVSQQSSPVLNLQLAQNLNKFKKKDPDN